MIEAKQVVITAGAYTSQLVKDLGVELRVTRQMQIWVEPDANSDSVRIDRALPFIFFFENDGDEVYGHGAIPG